jgi:hypothetical protein
LSLLQAKNKAPQGLQFQYQARIFFVIGIIHIPPCWSCLRDLGSLRKRDNLLLDLSVYIILL